jgi:hypothetical protein
MNIGTEQGHSIFLHIYFLANELPNEDDVSWIEQFMETEDKEEDLQGIDPSEFEGQDWGWNSNDVNTLQILLCDPSIILQFLMAKYDEIMNQVARYLNKKYEIERIEIAEDKESEFPAYSMLVHFFQSEEDVEERDELTIQLLKNLPKN